MTLVKVVLGFLVDSMNAAKIPRAVTVTHHAIEAISGNTSV